MSWFYRLQRRDQMALLVLSLALLVYCLWFGLIRTLQEQSVRQQQRTEASAETLLRVQALAGEISLLERQGAQAENSPINLPQLVDRSLRENQLRMGGFQPGRDGDVRLRLESADFDQLMQWLYQLEVQHGIRVGELSLLPTRQPGQVSVQVQLLGGAL